MRHAAPARSTTSGMLGPVAAGLVVITAVVIGTGVQQSAPSSAPSFSDPRSPGAHIAVLNAPSSSAPSSSAPSFSEARGGEHARATSEPDGAVTEEDGLLPDGVTTFDGEFPGIAHLNPDLLHALREAATDAADDGVVIYVNSGWRSKEYQRRLLREAVSKYGSDKAAARWVATPDTSPHVSGDAVDVGPVEATTWLSKHGARYGLCQIYGNESWHYELRIEAVGRGCPPMYADPTHDPRMEEAV